VKVIKTRIPDVLTLEPTIYRDARGYFFESWRQDRVASIGIQHPFVQDNHSYSVQGTLRGLHYQLGTPQGKLVRVVTGTVFDVAVDLRRSSPTYGQWVSETLTASEHRQIWIPPGFAHGFYTLSDTADLVYKCTAYYAPADDRTLRWDDPDLAIPWPLVEGRLPMLSAKDAAAPALRDAPTYS
jgi:dTDP-4-dehydrorhamnose 3,5-epimerase